LCPLTEGATQCWSTSDGAAADGEAAAPEEAAAAAAAAAEDAATTGASAAAEEDTTAEEAATADEEVTCMVALLAAAAETEAEKLDPLTLHPFAPLFLTFLRPALGFSAARASRRSMWRATSSTDRACLECRESCRRASMGSRAMIGVARRASTGRRVESCIVNVVGVLLMNVGGECCSVKRQ